MSLDPNRLILTGENPFICLSATKGGTVATNASFWRILWPPPARKYGVCTVLIPALGARLTVNGAQAKGRPFPTQREGKPFSTCALAGKVSRGQKRGPSRSLKVGRRCGSLG